MSMSARDRLSMGLPRRPVELSHRPERFIGTRVSPPHERIYTRYAEALAAAMSQAEGRPLALHDNAGEIRLFVRPEAMNPAVELFAEADGALLVVPSAGEAEGANDAPIPTGTSLPGARQTLVAALSAIPKVDAVSLRVDGDCWHVRVVVAEHDVDVTDAVADVQNALSARFEGLRFDLSVTAHQGRGASRVLPRGEERVYSRAP